MRKRASFIAVLIYGLLVALLVWRADVKLGPEAAVRLGLVGLVLLLVILRLWRGLRYIFAGGRVPTAAIGSTQFQRSTPTKDPPRP